MIKKVKDVFKGNKKQFSKEELEQQLKLARKIQRSIEYVILIVAGIIMYSICSKASIQDLETIKAEGIYLVTVLVVAAIVIIGNFLFFEDIIINMLEKELEKREEDTTTRKREQIVEFLLNQDYASLMILCPEIEFLLKQHLMRLYLKKNVVKVEMKEEGIKIQMKTRVIWINWEEVTELFDLKENESQIIDSLFFEEDDEELLS